MKRLIHYLLVVSVLATGAGRAQVSPSASEDPLLASAESYIDAFYTYDPAAIDRLLPGTEPYQPAMVYYQGWSKASNQTILQRHRCGRSRADELEYIACSLLLEDDVTRALGVGGGYQSVFLLRIENEVITSVTGGADYPEIYYEAEDWIFANRRESLANDCGGYFNDGETPDACVRTILKGITDYTAEFGTLPEAE